MSKANREERLRRRKWNRYWKSRYEPTPKAKNTPIDSYYKTRLFCKKNNNIIKEKKPRQSAHRHWLHNLTIKK